MAIEFFTQDDEQPSLEFLPDALEENSKLDGKIFDVFSFKKAKSGKGYMLYTSHFICWFFKKEKVLTQALEALDFYCKTGTGFQFVVQVDKKAKSKFHLGIDSERTAKYIPLENASFRLVNGNDMEDTQKENKAVNPFLLKIPLPSLLSPNTEPLTDGDLPSPTIPQGKKGRGTTN
jgi:hypothetical protein